MKTTGWVATFVAVGFSLQGYAVVVTPPDIVSTMMLLFVATPPAIAATVLGRRSGLKSPASPPAQAFAMVLGFALMCAMPWWANAQLEAVMAAIEAGADPAEVGSSGKWMMVLGPVAWCAAVGWVAGSRNVDADAGES